MKNLLLIAIIITLNTSCNKTVTDIYTIKNNSTFNVSMQDIRGANKTAINNLEPGGTDQLSYQHKGTDGYEVEFSYGPSNNVKSDIDTKGKKITFTNR